MQMRDFFRTLVARVALTDADRARMVQRLAIGGWGPASIPNFMASVVENHDPRAVFGNGGDPGSFLGYPSQVDMSANSNNNGQRNEWEQAQQYGNDFGDYAGPDDQVMLAYSRNTNRNAEDSVRREYDQLVQEYWKRVEIPN